MFGVDWQTVLLPKTPLAEIVVRGSLTYLALFVLLRFIVKRQSGGLGLTDLLVIVLIADASQNAMADDYRSVGDGILLVLVIVGWAALIDWLSFHVPWLSRLASPRAIPLVRDGRLLRRNMQRELVDEDELMSQLRLHGVADLREVRSASVEGDGRISVVRRDDADTSQRDEHPLM